MLLFIIAPSVMLQRVKLSVSNSASLGHKHLAPCGICTQNGKAQPSSTHRFLTEKHFNGD